MMNVSVARCRIGAAVLALICVVTPVSRALAAWDSMRALEMRRGATVTAVAVDLDNGKVIQSLSPALRLTPASLTKLVLAAAALDTWPADKTFATRILANGAIEGDSLVGDLMVVGEGDSTFDHQSLWFLAAQVKQAGISTVDGDLVINPLPFGPLACETKDRCEGMVRTHTSYDALPSAFGVDYGSWCLDVKPTLPGAAAQIFSCAGVGLPIPLSGSVNTATPLDSGLWLDRVTLPDGDTLSMGGGVASGAPVRLYRSMGDPALGGGQLLRQVLASLGVTVRGNVVVEPQPVPTKASLLAEMQGMPLREQIQRLLRYSNNYITDVLTLNIAAQQVPEPVSSLASASRNLSDLVQRALLAANHPDAGPPTLLSGSGLTPENRLSAQDLVAVLEYEYRRTETFPVYYAGLVVPGQAPHGYLKRGNTAWKERVALKTGTLSEPHSVFGTAGYLRKSNGGWIAFAVLANGAPRKPVPMRETLAAIRSDIDRLLARY